jgi:hypothetical protein
MCFAKKKAEENMGDPGWGYSMYQALEFQDF